MRPIKLMSDEVDQTLPASQQQDYRHLNALSVIIQDSDASLQSKQNALRLIETFKFILLNNALIERKFNGDNSVYKNQHDRESSLLRDHNDTSFHLNSYVTADEAILSLHKMMRDLIGAYETAQALNCLTIFIEKFEYDHTVGCLEARVSRPLIYIAALKSTGVENIDEVIQQVFASTPEQEDFVEYIKTLKKTISPYITKAIMVDGFPKILYWDLVKNQLIKFLLIDKGTTDHFLLNQLFSPIEIYFDYLKNTAVEIRVGQSKMVQHCFFQENDAEEFRSYLKTLSCLENEKYFQEAHIVHENKKFVVRLTEKEIKNIAKSSHVYSRVLLQWCKGEIEFFPEFFSSNAERAACGALDEPYYAKTITGFRNKKAWQYVVNAMTLRDRQNKPLFRDKKYRIEKPFRVRLNPYTSQYEVHDVRDIVQSLHEKEKERRRRRGEIPLPPHQSFTYYDPTDDNFKVGFFSPSSLTDQQKEEMIGIRVKIEGSFLNRLIARDQGTAEVFYGFNTQEAAENSKKQIEANNHWARTHDELKAKQKMGRYNEAMLRANLCCDGSSQVEIYSSKGSLTAKYLVILHKMDLEAHLKSHRKIYEKAPVNWYEGYQAPISFWDQKSPILYLATEQAMDLEKECANPRTAVLKAFIFFLQKKPIPENLYQIMRNSGLILSVLSFEKLDCIEALDFVAISKERFFDHLYRKLIIEPFIADKTHLFDSIGPRAGMTVIETAIKLFIKENNDRTLQEILLTEYMVGKDKTSALMIACQHNYLVSVEALINAALRLKEKNEADATLKTMLLADSVVAFVNTAEKRYEKIIEIIVKAAEILKKKDQSDRELQSIFTKKNSTVIVIDAMKVSRENAALLLNQQPDYATPLLANNKKKSEVLSMKEKANNRFFEDILPDLFLRNILGYCSMDDLYHFRLVSKKWCANSFVDLLDIEYQLPFISSFVFKRFLKLDSLTLPEMKNFQLKVKEKFLLSTGAGFLHHHPELLDESVIQPFFDWVAKKNTLRYFLGRLFQLSFFTAVFVGPLIYLLGYIFNKIPQELTLKLGNSCCVDSCLIDTCQQISCQTVLTDQAATEQWLAARADAQNYVWAFSKCTQYLPMCEKTNGIGVSAKMIDGNEQAGMSIDCDGFTAKVFSYIGFSLLVMVLFGIICRRIYPAVTALFDKKSMKNCNAVADFFKNRIAETKERNKIQVVTDESSLNTEKESRSTLQLSAK